MCSVIPKKYAPPKEEKKAVSLIKPYTNFDRIKDMTIEELAEFISTPRCQYCVYKDEPCDIADCKDGLRQYLESEAEE